MTQSRSSALASFDQFLAAGGFRSYLAGLTLSTGGGSVLFSVGAGVAMDSTNADLMALTSAISKNCSTAWASGTGNGSLDTGSLAASTWYHTHLIYNPTSGAVDVLTSLSATAPTLPSGYTLFRRIGSMKTDPTPVLLKFIQVGDKFLWSAAVVDLANGTPTATTAYSLSVPSGVTVEALIRSIFINSGTQNAGLTFSSPLVANPSSTSGNTSLISPATSSYGAGEFSIPTDTSGHINATPSSTSGNGLYIDTYGWIDRRGRDA